jgi:casein kinase II subunit beta
MYKERGFSASKSEDRKRINDVLDKQLERSSPSTSRPINGKHVKERETTNNNIKDPRSASASKTSNISGTHLLFNTLVYVS